MRLLFVPLFILIAGVSVAEEAPPTPGYIVFHSTVTDYEALGAYGREMMPVMTEYGGSFIVLADGSQALEGDPDTRRMAILAFPTVQAARDFWDSEGYQAAKQLRAEAGSFDAVLVTGLPVPLDSNTPRPAP